MLETTRETLRFPNATVTVTLVTAWREGYMNINNFHDYVAEFHTHTLRELWRMLNRSFTVNGYPDTNITDDNFLYSADIMELWYDYANKMAKEYKILENVYLTELSYTERTPEDGYDYIPQCIYN